MREQVVSQRTTWVFGLLGAGLALFIGASLVVQPVVAWLVFAGLAAVLLLQFPPYLVASAAVVAAVFSRLFVAWGIAPGFLNFLHFPLALMAAFVAALAPARSTTVVPNRLLMGISAFGLLSLLSWVAGGGEILRPVLGWLLFAEPFSVLFAIIKTAAPAKAPILGKLAIGLAVIQIPFAFWQAATLGLSDVVQGTLVGHGAGHHIIGALTLMGVLMVAASMLFRSQGRIFRFLLMLLLFAVPILSDAKQTVVAFIPALAVLLWTQGKIGWRGPLVGGGMAVLLVTAGYLYQPLRMVTNLDLVLAGLGGKVLSYKTISSRMLGSPAAPLLGLGPGHSVSRAALAAQEGYIRSLPRGLVDLQVSPVTADILSSTEGVYLFASSSVWSGISSWLGLFGDFGLLGVGIYVWMLWILWKAFGRVRSPWAYTGKAVLVMGVVLGAVFSWLEMPEFTLPWALYMAVGLVSRNHENSSHPQPVPATRR
jgi:hypothetical protein